MKKEAFRMCVACRQSQSKEALWRFARTLDGMVYFDPEQSKPGRGTYTCSQQKCLNAAIHKKAFARGFKKPILGISMENGESAST